MRRISFCFPATPRPPRYALLDDELEDGEESLDEDELELDGEDELDDGELELFEERDLDGRMGSGSEGICGGSPVMKSLASGLGAGLLFGLGLDFALGLGFALARVFGLLFGFALALAFFFFFMISLPGTRSRLIMVPCGPAAQDNWIGNI